MIHADYLYFLYFIFTNWGYTSSNVPIPFSASPSQDGKGNTHLALRFRTLAVPSLSYIYNMFCLNNKKIVPSNIGDFLNARALAFWIMDGDSWAGPFYYIVIILHYQMLNF